MHIEERGEEEVGGVRQIACFQGEHAIAPAMTAGFLRTCRPIPEG